MTELDSLLLSCLTSGDETPRLVLADFLEERMPVPDWEDRAAMIRRSLESIKQRSGYYKASKENDRVQDQLEDAIAAIRRRHEGPCETCQDHRKVEYTSDTPEGRRHPLVDCPTCALATRTRWDRCPCPTCNGSGIEMVDEEVNSTDRCQTCGGSGDLLLRYQEGEVEPWNQDLPSSRPRNITYPRGLPCVGATMAEMVREEASPPEVWNRGHGTGRVLRPTPWLLALPLRYELRVEGVSPFQATEDAWIWLRQTGEGQDNVIPQWCGLNRGTYYDSPAEASAALNLAVNRLRVQWWMESQEASDLAAGQ